MNSEFTSEVVACYYSFKISHILIGGVDTNQNLIICAEASYTSKPISSIAKQLLTYSMPIWINTHQALRYSLEGWLGGELDFHQEGEVESLNDLYDSLIAEGRLKAPALTLLGQNIQPCLKILIKALKKDLCCEQQGDFWVDVGEPREICSIFEGY